MTYRADPHRVIVGSEPFDGERGVWHSLSSGSYLAARRQGDHVVVKVGTIPVPAALEIRPPPA